jgi:hypothetical protein
MFHQSLLNGHLHHRMRKNLKRKKNGMSRNLQNHFLFHQKKNCHYNEVLQNFHHHSKYRSCLLYYGYCLHGYTMNSFLVPDEYKHH